MIDEDLESQEIQDDQEYARILRFSNINKTSTPVLVSNDAIWPLGSISKFCSFCCSDYNVKKHELKPEYGISWCPGEPCLHRAMTALGYAYSMEMPLYLIKPINTHVLSDYDNITEGYITYICFDDSPINPTLYAHVEWHTKYYNDSKNIKMSDIIANPKNGSTNFIDAMTQGCGKYTCYSYEKYKKYKDALGLLYMENSVMTKMDNLKINYI